jgi:hypothetical protein
MSNFAERLPLPEKKRFHEQIMTYEECAKQRRPRPYEYHLRAGEKELVMFGPKHGSDPQNPMFAKIREHINTFQLDLVMIEGWDSVNRLSPEDLAARWRHFRKKNSFLALENHASLRN